MLGSLGWGWAAKGVGDGCVCPEGENNTLDCRRKGRECENENFPPFLALGTNHSIKITWDWMSGLCQDRSGPAPPPPPGLKLTSLMLRPLLFLSSFSQFLPQGRRCCFLYWSLSPCSSKARPLYPSPSVSLSPGQASLGPTDPSPLSSVLPDPFVPQPISCVHASVLLFPYPEVWLPSLRREAGRRAGGHHLGPLPLLCPSNHSGLSVLGFSEKQGPPGASQRRLVPVAPALLQPPPAPVGLCGSMPRLRLPPSLQPNRSPPPYPTPRAQRRSRTSPESENFENRG